MKVDSGIWYNGYEKDGLNWCISSHEQYRHQAYTIPYQDNYDKRKKQKRKIFRIIVLK